MSEIKSANKNSTNVQRPSVSQKNERTTGRVKRLKILKPGEQVTSLESAEKRRPTSKSVTLASFENPQDLPPVVVAVSESPHIKEPSIPLIGFNLSTLVLLMISGFILFLILYLSVKEFDASSYIAIPAASNFSDSSYARKVELIRMIQEEKKSNREFTVQIAQMILLNLLLPILTAILGYIFASNKKDDG